MHLPPRLFEPLALLLLVREDLGQVEDLRLARYEELIGRAAGPSDLLELPPELHTDEVLRGEEPGRRVVVGD